ncbi:serine/threonine-protein kinase [Reticulibacter mediterranei]|uniref:serine/threonine-protein kinase n=1 Tax=Reticulibacter mediterranei TaxID=2778369 RepID=UPI001C68FC65|nr:serine/threonine-protein kinase [Reticulibacter mediterranei]
MKSTDIDDRTGQQIGDYRLLRQLGEGSSTVVYLGEHLQQHSQVAIKMLHTKLVARERAAFLEEMSTVAELDHPGIVRVLDWGNEQGYPYVVMNYVPGGTLRQRYPKGSRLPLGLVVRYINQLADALQYAHERNFIHRNIKPENMLSGDDEQVLLSDFGLALISSASITQGSQLGASTLAYMAPEHIVGKSQPASDQYALAVVVYEWLAGEQMFQGTLAELSNQHLYAPPPPLQEKNPAVTSELEDVLIKALAKDPAQRYASVQDFAAALTQSVPADVLNAPVAEDEGDITDRKDAPGDSSALPEFSIEQLAFPDVGGVAQDDPDRTDPFLRVPATPEKSGPLADTDKSAKVAASNDEELSTLIDNEADAWPFAPDVRPIESNRKLQPLALWQDATGPMKRNIVIATVLLVLLLVSSLAFAFPLVTGRGLFGPPPTPTPTPLPLTANITITPQQKEWNKTYSLSAVTGTPHATQHQVQARVLTVTTPAQAQTAQASGKRVMPGTGVAATGTLTFDNTALVPLAFPAGTVLANTLGTVGATQVVLNAPLVVPAASAVQSHVQASVAVHVVKVGKAGNIAAGQFVVRGTAGAATAPNWSATNPAAFAGGVDERTYMYVQQSDIDTTAAALIQANAPAPAQVLKPKISANERLVGEGACTPGQQANHQANEQAANVTVSVWFTCSGNLYDYDRASMLTASLLRDEMKTAHYTAINTVKTTLKQQRVADDQGTIVIQIQAQARGSYYFDDAAIKNIANQLAGKSMSAAETWLHGQTSISVAKIKLSGGTGKQVLPARAQDITISVS